MFSTTKEAEKICGSLSKPSKMPCYGYSIPASRCKVGMKMRNVKNSVCSVCYALKGRYAFKSIQAALERRFESLSNPLWVKAIAFLIGKKEKSGYFRWHDSGDLQGEWHLQKIVDVAKELPSIKFWLPTREYNIVNNFVDAYGALPDNLTVRFSALMLDGEVKPSQNPNNFPTSEASNKGFTCPSFNQGNKCLDCRACWDKTVETVTYKKH